MSERFKESVLKTEVLIGIPGVRIPLHPRGHKFSLALSIEKNESDRRSGWMEWVDGGGSGDQAVSRSCNKHGGPARTSLPPTSLPLHPPIPAARVGCSITEDKRSATT
jgi:hypothetical protein